MFKKFFIVYKCKTIQPAKKEKQWTIKMPSQKLKKKGKNP